MSYSSPEGIVLGKGSKLVSAELSINKEKVFSIKQEKLYTEEELFIRTLEAVNVGMRLRQDQLNGWSYESGNDTHKEWFEKIK